jgi:hypothetical protein
MANAPAQGGDIQFLLSDLNTRIRDAEERNKITKERALLVGKNLIETKQETSDELKEIKLQNTSMQREIEKLQKISNSLIEETGKYIKREEMILLERMLKDFQPLEFVRMKDLEEAIEQKIKTKK